MAHKRKTDEKMETAPYTMADAIKITDEVFKLSKENKYHPGAFVHGLIFALEYAQVMYDIPQQQLATIKRDCRKYLKDVTPSQKKPESTK